MRGLIALAGRLDPNAVVRESASACRIRIAADGGLEHLDRLGLIPDRVVGDMDSIRTDRLPELEALGVRTDRHPRDKDETDAEIAIRTALDMGATDLLIIGALGSRPDHTLAHQLLAAGLARRGVPCRLTDGTTWMHALSGAHAETAAVRLDLPARGFLVSLLAISGPAIGVSTKGLRFGLDRARLPDLCARGVSNRPDGSGSPVEIRLEAGELLVFVVPAD